MSARLQLACVADERYAPHCAAMLQSLFVRHPDTTVHYLHPAGMAAAVQDRFRVLAGKHGAELRFYPIEAARVQALPPMHGHERIMWHRIFLAELLPELDRVLYLDADTLIADRLDELWKTDLDGYHLAAVRMVFDPLQKAHLARLGLAPGTAYFNSGVLLLNLASWRRDRGLERILEVTKRHGERFIWVDQDALNLAFAGSTRLLHPRWNCQNSLYVWKPWAREVFGRQALDEATRAPAIVHFEGPAALKPWHYLCHHRYRRQYWQHLRDAGYPPPPIEGRNAGNFLRKHIEWLRAPIADLTRPWRVRP